MPLPEDDYVNSVADELVATIRETFGTPTHTRPVHARGQLVKGTFVPSHGARFLSKAPIFKTASTPLLARFSCDTGFPDIKDTHIDSNPRGLAIRFLLSDDGHTHFDVITNTAIGFPVDRGEGFFRTRLVPPQGVMKMAREETEEKKGTYLFDNLEERLSAKPSKPIIYNWMAQIGDPKVDKINDSSSEWPEDREFVHLGTFTFDRLWTMGEGEVPGRDQQRIIFDPMPRYMEGIGE